VTLKKNFFGKKIRKLFRICHFWNLKDSSSCKKKKKRPTDPSNTLKPENFFSSQNFKKEFLFII